jgi:hypothetical protein
MPKSEDRVVMGTGGWLWAVFPDELGDIEVYARVVERPNGRLGIGAIELVSVDDATIDTNVLRRVPTGRLEAAVNRLGAAEELRRRVENDGADTDARDRAARDERAPRDAEGFLSKPPSPSMRRLRIPPGRPKPDEFYVRVARLYGDLSPHHKQPAHLIAEANDVPITTVHGWLKEARRRGLMSPGRRSSEGDS